MIVATLGVAMSAFVSTLETIKGVWTCILGAGACMASPGTLPGGDIISEAFGVVAEEAQGTLEGEEEQDLVDASATALACAAGLSISRPQAQGKHNQEEPGRKATLDIFGQDDKRTWDDVHKLPSLMPDFIEICGCGSKAV